MLQWELSCLAKIIQAAGTPDAQMRSPSDLTKLRALRGAAINTGRLHACRLSEVLRLHLDLICQLSSGGHHQHRWPTLLEWLDLVAQHLRECRQDESQRLPTPRLGHSDDVASRCCHGPAICLNSGWSCKTCLQHSLHRSSGEIASIKCGDRRWDLTGTCDLGLSQIRGVLPIVFLRVISILWPLIVTEIPLTVLRHGTEVIVAGTPVPMGLGLVPLVAVTVALVTVTVAMALVAEALAMSVKISLVSSFLIAETVKSSTMASSLALMRIVALASLGTVGATSEAATAELSTGLHSHLSHGVKPTVAGLCPEAFAAEAPVPLCPPLRRPVTGGRALLHGRGLPRVELVISRNGRRAIPHGVVGCCRRLVAGGVVPTSGRALGGVGSCCR
mmetsp:Transcript_50807/g.108865  ORF Transcript_50807/g.108865 Transcript_50807/m.108865 type:complete len:389 (-) Transcript_50807:273-1439(-)